MKEKTIETMLQESASAFSRPECKVKHCICTGCKYYNACGDPDRTEPCQGKEK